MKKSSFKKRWLFQNCFEYSIRLQSATKGKKRIGKHPETLKKEEIMRFLLKSIEDRRWSESAQNHAVNALAVILPRH